jgi:hypothetical protein
MVNRYEQNLVNLIRSLRHDFHAPRAKFSIATIGFGGFNMTEEAQEVTKAHLAVSGDAGKYPAFRGNVHTVNIRSSWRKPEGVKNPDHYHQHAKTYLRQEMLLAGLWQILSYEAIERTLFFFPR